MVPLVSLSIQGPAWEGTQEMQEEQKALLCARNLMQWCREPCGQEREPQNRCWQEPEARPWEEMRGGHIPCQEQPQPGSVLQHSALWPSAREALKSISLLKYRKLLENT